jgi:S-methylmethionine-dependent homocysteine/selenocysteine methylase
MTITLLDGPMGTELIARGHQCPSPAWSAAAIEAAPEDISAIHAAYAHAGAVVHTTNTFRTRPDAVGSRWTELAQHAVHLAKKAVPLNHRIAGSMAPLADCYRPDLSPIHPRPAHAALAKVLAAQHVDILLCETFPHIGEAEVATSAAIETGIETWVSFTAGPDGTLLTPDQIRKGAERAIALGASALLVNCIPASQTTLFLAAIADLGVPFGAYANAGHPDEGMGWVPSKDAPERYADHAESWVAMGATLLGSCCGTGPQHIHTLWQRFCT